MNIVESIKTVALQSPKKEKAQEFIKWLDIRKRSVIDMLDGSDEFQLGINRSQYFEQFLNDNKELKTAFPDGKKLKVAIKKLNGSRNALAHPPQLPVVELEKLKNEFKSKLEQNKLYEHAHAACEAMKFYANTIGEIEDSDDEE